MPFIIHAKDSGAPIRGLTAGIMQGMELRRQFKQDELLQQENKRNERLSLLKEQIHEKDLLIKSAAARKADLENQQIEGRMGYAARKAEHLKGLKKGPGIRGKLNMPSDAQNAIMSSLVKNGASIAALDTQFQGVAVHPSVVQAMEYAHSEAQFEEAEWAKLDPATATEARKKWYASKAEELQYVMQSAERELIEQYFADPMMQPTDDLSIRSLHFDGIKDSTWDTYTAEYNEALTAYRSGKVSHTEVLTQLEAAESALFQGYYRDQQFEKMHNELKSSGALDAAAAAAYMPDDLIAGDSAAMQKSAAYADAHELWMKAQAPDARFDDLAAAFLAMHEAHVGATSNLTGYIARKKRDELTRSAQADELEIRYQNTIRYMRDPKMQRDYKARIGQMLDARGTLDMETLGEIIAEIESKGGAAIDHDIYRDLFADILTEKGLGAAGSAEKAKADADKPVEKGDTEEALRRLRQKAKGLESYASLDSNQRRKLINEAQKAWEKAGGNESPAKAQSAFEDSIRQSGYDPQTVPSEALDQAAAGSWSNQQLPQKMTSLENEELIDWLTLPTANDGAGLQRSDALRLISRNEKAIQQAITRGLGKYSYNRIRGFKDTDWLEILGPIIEVDVNRQGKGK